MVPTSGATDSEESDGLRLGASRMIAAVTVAATEVGTDGASRPALRSSSASRSWRLPRRPLSQRMPSGANDESIWQCALFFQDRIVNGAAL